jgi:hypothetical protein
MVQEREAEAEEIRQAIAALGTRARTARFPEPIRRRVVEYVRAGRADGTSWQELAAGVGLAATTVHHWMQCDTSGPERRALVPVHVRLAGVGSRERTALRIRTAGGTWLEGANLAQAITVLRALG